MIQAITILLALILVGLLVDWPRLLKRSGRGGSQAGKSSRKHSTTVSAQTYVPFGETEKVEVTEPVEEAPLPPPSSVSPVEERPSRPLSPEVEDLLAEADVHFRKGEMKAAEKFYLQAAAKDPRCSKAYSRLGVIYLENGDNWEDAEAAFRQALKTDSQNGYILNNLGLVLYHQDKYADAIRQFEQAVRQDEYNAARHANLGMAYMAMRQYAKAESSFKKALKLDPNEMEYKDLLNESIEKKKAHKTMIRH